MKLTFVLAAITLALAALPVAAAERLPAKLVGNWCSVDAPKSEGEWIYNRTTTQCPIGTIARMKIRTDGMDEQDGTDGPSGKCQLLQMIVIKSDDYLAKLHCNSEGQISTEVKRLTLKGNRLVTSVVGEKADEATQADHANDPAPSADKRCVVVDPTGTPLNVGPVQTVG